MGTGKAAALLGAVLLLLTVPHALRGTVPLEPGSDPATQVYPWLELARESLAAGQAPLWNPYAFAGAPLLGNGQSAVFYPLNLPFYLLGGPTGMVLGLAARIFVFGLFTFLLLRRLGIGSEAAAVGMLTASFSGYLLGWIAFPIANVACLLPAALFTALRLVEVPSRQAAALLTMVLGSQVLGGQPQSMVACWLLTGCFAGWAGRSREVRAAGLLWTGTAFLLAIGVGAVQLLPFWEYLRASAAWDARGLLNHYWYPALPHLTTFVLPDFFGELGGRANWGLTPTRELTAYIGLLPLMAVLFSWGHTRFRPLVLFLGVWCGAALLLLYRLPSFAAVSWLIETAGLQGYGMQKLLGPLSFCLVILGAIGFDRLLLETPARCRSRVLMVGAGLAAVSLLAIWPYIHLIVALELWGETAFRLTRTVVLLAAGVLVFGWVRPRRWRTAAAGLLVTADLLAFGASALPATPLTALRPAGESARLAASVAPASGRFDHAGGVLPPNFGVLTRSAGVRGYDALTPLDYMRYLDALTGRRADWNAEVVAAVRSWDPAEAPSRDTLALQHFHRLYEHYGDRFLELLRRARYGFAELTPIARRPLYNRLNVTLRVGGEAPSGENWRSVGRGAFENLEALPRVRLVARAVSAEGGEALERLASGDIDPTRTVVLPASGGEAVPSDPDSPQAGSAVILEYRPGRVLVDVRTSRPAWLVLADRFDTGWTALINGDPAPVLRADALFRAVRMGAGESVVEFTYDPAAFRLGKWLSLLSLLIVATLVGSTRLRRHR